MTNKKNFQRMSFIRKHRSFFVGIFVFIPIILIPLLLVYTLANVVKVEFIQGWLDLYAVYENSFGLTNGNPVTISGMNIGHIKNIELVREGCIKVHLKVRRQYAPLIRKDTKALLKQKNMFVGDWSIELTGGTKSVAAVNENDTLISELPAGIDKTINQITNAVTLIQEILTGIQGGKGTVGKLIKEDSIAVSANLIEKNVSKLALETTKSIHKIDSLTTSLTRVSENGNQLIDSVHIIVNKIQTAMDNVNAIVKNVQTASGDVSPMITQVKSDLGEAERMMQSLQQGWLFKTISKNPKDPLLDKAP